MSPRVDGAGHQPADGVVFEEGATLKEDESRRSCRGLGEKWNIARANQLLRTSLSEIDELSDKLSLARAEALLDEFEHDINAVFLRRHMSAVMAHCDRYSRRFRALSEEKG
jgi:hypothetical protein